jgi:hypothetical protein
MNEKQIADLEKRSAILLSVALGLGFVATAGIGEAAESVRAQEICYVSEEQEFPGPKEAPGESIIPPRHKPGFKNHSKAF